MDLFSVVQWMFLFQLTDLYSIEAEIQVRYCKCGQINDLNTRIVGGDVIQPHRYPWLTVILKRNKFHCGGSIINDRYILTAGHCIYGKNRVKLGPSSLSVVVGVHDRNDFSEPSRVEDAVVDIKVPNYVRGCNMHDVNDIALLKTKNIITFNQFVSPICLPPPHVFDYDGEFVTVAGWGTTGYRGSLSQFPKEALIKVLPNRECLGAPDVGVHFSENPVAMFCAYQTKADACKGDSGGPVTQTTDDRVVQIGIVSWGIKCAVDNHPGVYTRLPYYIDWIHENTKDAHYCLL